MISGLTLLIMIWATGVLVFLMAECPECKKEMKQSSIAGHLRNKNIHPQYKRTATATANSDGDDDDDDIPHRFGGELSALERRYKDEPRKLYIAKADYLRDHAHHKDIVRTKDGITLKLGRRDDDEDDY